MHHSLVTMHNEPFCMNYFPFPVPGFSLPTPLFLIVFCESKLEKMAISTPHIWPLFPYKPQNRPYMGVASSAYARMEWPSYG
jgi:hypothetical protein